MGRRPNHLQEGAWSPARINWLVLALETFVTLQAASRGFDYLQPRPQDEVPVSLTTMEAALPLPVWGTCFLLLAGAVFLGLFGGWWTPIVVGHAGLAGLYAAFSYGVLDQAPIHHSSVAVLGLFVVIPGLVLGSVRWKSWRWLRITAACVLTAAGGWIVSYGLGYDFRTGTSLLTATAIHAAFAIRVAYVAHWRPPPHTA
jgi:hypothetical protein